jgi:hypothetical protein
LREPGLSNHLHLFGFGFAVSGSPVVTFWVRGRVRTLSVCEPLQTNPLVRPSLMLFHRRHSFSCEFGRTENKNLGLKRKQTSDDVAR